MVQHMLVAVDGSPGSRHALTWACDLAQATGARLTAAIAVEVPLVVPMAPLEGFISTAPHPGPEQLKAAQADIDAARQRLGADRVTERIETGAAADTLLVTAEAVGADLIVVGARGLNPAQRWLLGSVSDRVVHHAQVPVVVVR